MGSSRARRVRRSRAEWEWILERSEFCRREGISEATFAHWRGRLGASPVARYDFVELEPMSLATARPAIGPVEMELSLPGGVRLRLRA